MGADSDMKQLADAAAARLDADRQTARQLSMLPEADADLPETRESGRRGPGRPEGSKNKVSSQVRDWLAARGFRMPEDQLAEIAALGTSDDAVTVALGRAERLLAYVGQSAENRVYKQGVGHVILDGPWRPAPDQFVDAFKFFYSAILRANEAVLPYVAPKTAGDAPPPLAVQIVTPAAPSPAVADPADQARDVTPRPGRMAPPPMPHEMQQKQDVSEAAPDNPDGRKNENGASQ